MLFRERQLMSSFKPGDWVILSSSSDSRSLAQVQETYSDSNKAKLYWPSENSAAVCPEMQYYELWHPKVGEWCWFINPNCAPLLAQFVKMQDQSFWINNEYESVLGYKANKFGHYSGNIGPKDEDYVFVYCEPFIGQLPTFIKDQS